MQGGTPAAPRRGEGRRGIRGEKTHVDGGLGCALGRAKHVGGLCAILRGCHGRKRPSPVGLCASPGRSERLPTRSRPARQPREAVRVRSALGSQFPCFASRRGGGGGAPEKKRQLRCDAVYWTLAVKVLQPHPWRSGSTGRNLLRRRYWCCWAQGVAELPDFKRILLLLPHLEGTDGQSQRCVFADVPSLRLCTITFWCSSTCSA